MRPRAVVAPAAPGQAGALWSFVASAGRGTEIFEHLEVPNWAPWLRFSPWELDAHAELFPDGQVLLCDEQSRPVGSLSSNRIAWDGVVEDLPTWDDVAGADRTYDDTYASSGNTLVLMSMNVRRDARARGVTHLLIDEARRVAAAEGIEHVLSDFRPSEYGASKLAHADLGFPAYCSMTRDDGLPVDGWLRSLTRAGMQPLRIDARALVVRTTANRLLAYRVSYHPERWRELTTPSVIGTRIAEHTPLRDLDDVAEVWECGEAGTWYVDRSLDAAVYIESNLWGRVPSLATRA